MSTQPEIRVSDTERQGAVDRLKAAHDEGRLDLLEYDRRLLLAHQAVTNRDLDQLFVDLPASAPVRAAPPSDIRQALEAAVARRLARPRPVPDIPLILASSGSTTPSSWSSTWRSGWPSTWAARTPSTSGRRGWSSRASSSPAPRRE